MSEKLFIAFIILYLVVMLLKIALNIINVRHIHKKNIDGSFKLQNIMDEETFRCSNRYSVTTLTFGIFEDIFEKLLLFTFLVSGAFV